MTSVTEHYESLFYDLQTGIVGNHERPHKPAMLLAVMDLVESGILQQNLIPFSKALRQRFTFYYEIVKLGNDRNTPLNPYFYLRSEDFWQHVPTPGNEALLRVLDKPPSIGKLSSLIAGAALAPELWSAINDPQSRTRLRDVLISRYFPQHRHQLRYSELELSLVAEDETAYIIPGRSAGFRRIVTQVYEHQCSACGLRLRRPDGSTIVDAAHIIPFSESQNDHPRNGLALCKNHHWAMDRSLIAPSPDFKWLVSQQLDSRQAGEMQLITLANKPLILPKEKVYHPLPEALEWRKLHLA